MFSLVFICFGVVYGVICSLLFFQMNPGWLKTFASVGFIVAFSESFNILFKLVSVSSVDDKRIALVSFLISLLLTIITVLIIMEKKFNDEKRTDLKLSILDFVLGQKEPIRVYYEDFKNKIEKIYVEKQKTIEYSDKRAKEILKMEEVLKKAKISVEKRIKELNDMCQTKSNLPIQGSIKFPVDELFLENMVFDNKNLLEFIPKVRDITLQYKNEISNLKNINNDIKIFKAFLLDLCYTTAMTFFNLRDARIHFRYLNGEKYIKLVCVGNGNSSYKKEMTAIPFDKGMINKASKLKCSLIKSLNLMEHYASENDQIWVDYLTLVFPEFINKDISKLSMGISIRNKDFKNTLLFLSYMKFEDVIQNELVFLNEGTNIIDRFIGGSEKNHEEAL